MACPIQLKSNPTPSSTTHNTPIEILWTIVPVFILIGIGIISLPILLKQLRIPKVMLLWQPELNGIGPMITLSITLHLTL